MAGSHFHLGPKGSYVLDQIEDVAKSAKLSNGTKDAGPEDSRLLDSGEHKPQLENDKHVEVIESFHKVCEI